MLGCKGLTLRRWREDNCVYLGTFLLACNMFKHQRFCYRETSFLKTLQYREKEIFFDDCSLVNLKVARNELAKSMKLLISVSGMVRA